MDTAKILIFLNTYKNINQFEILIASFAECGNIIILIIYVAWNF